MQRQTGRISRHGSHVERLRHRRLSSPDHEDRAVTTDLSDDFELGEDEFDWDVFVPDPDETELAAQAAALEDETELSLDDSEFDWEAALREDSEPEGEDAGSDGEARAGAAFDRIVDTVRRTFEEPESEIEAERDLGPEAEAEPQAVLEPEAEEPEAEEPEAELEPESEVGLEQLAELEPEGEFESGPEAEPQAELEPDAELEVDFEPEAELETEEDPQPEAGLAPEAELVMEPELEPQTPVSETEPQSEVGEPEREPAPEAVGTVELESSLTALPEAQWDHDTEPESARGPAHARTRNSAEKKPRSRVFTATLVLASLLVVFVAAVAVVRSLHHSTVSASPPVHSTSAVSTSSAVARLQTATDAADSATTSARVALTSLSHFPTPTNVETVINPYISSLQIYGTFLSETDAPPAARSAAASAGSQVRQDLKFLVTIEGLPPVQLGSYLQQFGTNATQLQTTLSALEQDLRPSGS
jgi:hypothetical protein